MKTKFHQGCLFTGFVQLGMGICLNDELSGVVWGSQDPQLLPRSWTSVSPSPNASALGLGDLHLALWGICVPGAVGGILLGNTRQGIVMWPLSHPLAAVSKV